MDECLRGGFRIGTITEVVGRAGVGKTQLAMQLCAVAARYEQGSVYIDTEKKISLRRLKEIAEERASAFNSSIPKSSVSISVKEGEFCYDEVDKMSQGSNPEGNEAQSEQAGLHLAYKSAEEVLENITVHSPASTNDLLSVVAGIEEEILVRNQEAEELLRDSGMRTKFPVRLIVLDSIAAPARRDFGAESAPLRVSALFKVAQMLKRLADQLQVAIVVINQVGLTGDKRGWNHTNGGDGPSTGSDLVSVSAALGTSWHHCVATRLVLEHERDPHRLNTTLDDAHDQSVRQSSDIQDGDKEAWEFARGHIRTATVVKSNVTGLSSMVYEVTAIGLSEIL